jgi:hypothetical protein
VSRKKGITEEQILDLARFESSDHFNEREKVVLRLATELTRTPANVSDEFYAALRAQFSERELVELSAAICWENYRARFNRTFAIGAEGFSKGRVCALPEHEPRAAGYFRFVDAAISCKPLPPAFQISRPCALVSLMLPPPKLDWSTEKTPCVTPFASTSTKLCARISLGSDIAASAWTGCVQM